MDEENSQKVMNKIIATETTLYVIHVFDSDGNNVVSYTASLYDIRV